MDDQRIGRVIRALRHRLGWRQQDLADVAGVTQDDVSRAERGRIESIGIRKLRRIGRGLDAELVLTWRWRGGELDRLLDEGHASVVGWLTATLTSLGWDVRPEVSYSLKGERGSIDLLAWHAATRTLLVVEVKTELTSIEETLRRHDAKQRLGAQIALDRFGWRPAAVCRLLALPGYSTPRRQVGRHAAVLDVAYRMRGHAARSWLRSPSGSPSLLVFVPPTHLTRGGRRSVSRRRVSRAPSH